MDSDLNSFNVLQFHVNSNWNYLFEDSWKTLIHTVGRQADTDIFAFIHLNIRSIPQNFASIIYLETPNFDFPFIGIN